MKRNINRKAFKGAAIIMLFALLLNTSAIYALDTQPEETPVPTDATEEAAEDPTEEPTPIPTEEPTEIPTEEPGVDPTEIPTEVPTEIPSEEPPEEPTDIPTEEPAEDPTEAPTEEPTETPTEEPALKKEVDLAPVMSSQGQEVIPDQYIVVYKDGGVKAASRESTIQTYVSKAGGAVKHIYDAAINGYSAYLPPNALEKVQMDPNVDYIQPDIVISINDEMSSGEDFSSEATQYNPTWGLDRIDERSRPMDNQYIYNKTGSGVNVYVIDSGIYRNHLDFGGRALYGYDAIKDGWGTADCCGHGTHVAGTIGSKTFGVAKQATLYAVRVLDCDGEGSAADAIAGVNWVINNHTKPAVANMSFGPKQRAVIPSLDQAVLNLINSGVTVVVAAGNSNDDVIYYSPARVTNAITVGNTQFDDRRYNDPVYGSNYGSHLDIFAPGTNITSTWIGSNTATYTDTGTSMAAPHVAGAAALYLQLNPSASPATVCSALVNNATKDKVINPGAGSPNKLLYTTFIGYVPSPPTLYAPTGTIIDRTPTFSWSNNNFNSMYQLEVYRGDTRLYTQFVNGKSSITPSIQLPYANLKWRVRAYSGGTWSAFSGYKYFYVSPAGFYSSFTSNAYGWKARSGGWTQSNGVYVGFSPADKWATTSHYGNYTDFTYQVKMKRVGGQYSANNLLIRGIVYPLDTDNDWDKKYSFQYNNNGKFSVWECSGGSCSALKEWTTSYAINKWNWNTLKVIAKGKYLKFYINNRLVWQGSDTSFYKGMVGISMYRSGTDISSSKLIVDSAQLSVLTSTSAAAEEVVDASDQVTIPGGSMEQSPIQ